MSTAAWAVLLAGAAGVVWGDRRQGVLRRLGATPGRRAGRARLAAAAALAGRLPPRLLLGAHALLVGALLAAERPVLAVVVGVAGSAAIARAHRAAAAQAAELRRVQHDLPRAATLLAACLQAGSSPAASVHAVAAASDGPLGAILRPVAAALRLGVDPALAWAPACQRAACLRRLARGYVRAATTGAPLHDVLAAIADDERHRARASAESLARRAGVRAVGPLAACYLPAFFLIGIVPLVVSVASDALGGLR